MATVLRTGAMVNEMVIGFPCASIRWLLCSAYPAFDADLRGHELYYSARWWEMLGYAPGERAADTDSWRGYVPADDLAPVEDFMARLLAPSDDCYRIEFRLRHRSGHYVPLLAMASR